MAELLQLLIRRRGKAQAELKAIEKKAKTAAVWARAGVTIPREKKEEGAQGGCGDV